jgi:hypothetical protein
MYIGLHVKYRYCCQVLMKLELSRQIFKKHSNIEFHENFRNFANAPKILYTYFKYSLQILYTIDVRRCIIQGIHKRMVRIQ